MIPVRWHLVLWGVAAVLFLTAGAQLFTFPSVFRDPACEGAAWVVGESFFGLIFGLAGTFIYGWTSK